MPGWALATIAWAASLPWLTVAAARFTRLGSGCTCRKHAWDPCCPRHGLGVNA